MILEEQHASHLVEFALLETKQHFAKRHILQIKVAPELRAIVTLTPDAIQINKLPSFEMEIPTFDMALTAQLLKTRGTHAFARETCAPSLKSHNMCVDI